jgi:hypothetical protein
MGGIKNSIDLELEVFNPSPHVFFPLAFFDFLKIVILSSCFCVCKMRKFKISFKKVGLRFR